MKNELYLTHDVLDNQLVDNDGICMGRADGIIIELQGERQPRITAIEVGAPALALGVHPWAVRALAACGRRWKFLARPAYRIPFQKVREVGIKVKLDLKAEDTPLLDTEKWLREHFVSRVPGSG